MKVVFHIGYHKTGTTALQAFLHSNRTILRKQSLCYVGNTENHYMYSVLYHKAEHLEKGLPKEALVTRKAFFEELERKRYDKVLLSSEGFCESPHVPELLAKDLADIVGGDIEIKIVVYLRRQDLWLQSAYQQRVKQANSRASETIDELIVTSRKFVDYEYRLGLWEKSFGRENIVVRIYEPESFVKSIFHDFSEAVGFDITDEFVFPEKRVSNIGIDYDVLEMMRLSNQLKTGDRLHQLLLNVASDLGRTTTSDSVALLSTGARKSIMDYYTIGNSEVARRYLGRRDGKLFSPLHEEDGSGKRHDLTIEGVASVLLRVIDRVLSNP